MFQKDEVDSVLQARLVNSATGRGYNEMEIAQVRLFLSCFGEGVSLSSIILIDWLVDWNWNLGIIWFSCVYQSMNIACLGGHIYTEIQIFQGVFFK